MANIKFSQFSTGNNLQVGDEVVGLRSGANTIFTFPSTGINDSSNNPMITWSSPGASAVNYLTLNSSLTTVNPSITVAGTDTNVGLTLNTKGNGNINIDPAGTGIITMQASARFANASAIQTGTTNSDTLLFQAYDVDGGAYTTLMTMTAGNNPSLSINASSLILSTPLAVTSGGTGTSTQFTQGSVVFAGASGVYTQDNDNLFWDDSNNRLGIGTNSPQVDLDVDGTTATTFLECQNLMDTSGDLVLQLLHNSNPVNFFYMYNVATGNAPVFAVQGSDTDIGILVVPKGAGQTSIVSTNNVPLLLTSGTNSHITNFSFANTAVARTVTFPDADGTVAFTSGASGIVNSGSANQLAYYASNGTTVSGLTTANDSVLVTNGSGVPSLATTLPSELLIPSPRIGLILDTNTNGMMKLSPTASAVNYFEFTNAATSNNPIIGVDGSDTNIGLEIQTKGTGEIRLESASTTPLSIVSGTSLQHTANIVFNSSSSSQTITFPDGSGTVAFVGDAISTIKTFRYSANATYTPSAGTVGVLIEMCGSGGGGGGCQNSTVGTSGGAGGYILQYLTAAEIGASLTLVVPSGGAGGGTNAAGTAGTATTVSTPSNVIVLTAQGGSGGSAGSNTTNAMNTGVSGGGASVSTGSVTYTGLYIQGGGSGSAVIIVDCIGSQPGHNRLGNTSRQITGGGFVQESGTGYGSGGGGACSNASGGNRSGAAGASGVVFITEYS